MAPSSRKKEKAAAEPPPALQVNIEPVVLQLSLPTHRLEHLLKGEDCKNAPLSDPLPYVPDKSFSNDSTLLSKNDQEENHRDLACFWCCHKIDSAEYGMPIRYDAIHGNFTSYGSFCSFECAAAYNVSVNTGCDRVWEIHSWIQLLAQRYGFALPIRPAPSRYVLKMFNGPMSIEEFRQAHKMLDRTYVANIPPLIHVTSYMDCVNTSFLDPKPTPVVKKKKSTIDQKMNLYIDAEQEGI